MHDKTKNFFHHKMNREQNFSDDLELYIAAPHIKTGSVPDFIQSKEN